MPALDTPHRLVALVILLIVFGVVYVLVAGVPRGRQFRFTRRRSVAILTGLGAGVAAEGLYVGLVAARR